MALTLRRRAAAPMEAPEPHPALGAQFHSPAAREAHNVAHWGAAASGGGYFQHASGRASLVATANQYAAQIRGAHATH